MTTRFVAAGQTNATVLHPSAFRKAEAPTRPMTTPCMRQAIPGCLHQHRISTAGLVFVLDKLAETVLPVRVRGHATMQQQAHPARICRDGCSYCWYFSGPAIDFDIADLSSGWLVQRATVYGEINSLEIWHDDQQAPATIESEKTHHQIWCALLQWLILKEAGWEGDHAQ